MIKKLCQFGFMVVFVVGLVVWPAPVAGQSDLMLFVTGVRADAFPEVQVDLRAINGSSQVVNNLTPAGLAVTEAGTAVKDFKLTANNNGAMQLVFVLDLDVYNQYTYQPGLTELQAAFTTLVTGGYFVDDRDTVQVLARINKNSDQTVELVPATHKGVDLTKWAQGFDFKGGSQRTNALLGVDETIKKLAATPNVGAQTTAIIYVGPRIASLPASVAASAATGYAQEAKDAHILLYAFHTGTESAGALNTLANGSGGTYVTLQRGSVATTVGGIYGALNAQRAVYTLDFRSTVGTSGKRDIKVYPAGAPANGPQTVTASYNVTVQSPVIKITSPAVGARVMRNPGGGPQKETVTAKVESWPDGHPRELKEGVLTVNGQLVGQLNAPTGDGVYEFQWDISSITQPGEHAMSLQVTVTDELGQQGTDAAMVGVAIPEVIVETPTVKPGETAVATPDPCVANPAACKGQAAGIPWMWVGLGVGLLLVIVAALVALIVVITRMRRPAVAAAPVRAPEETGSETIMVESRPQVTLAQIKIMQGPPDMMGRTIDISRRTTVLGRAPQGADIVFYADDDRSVISRRHCTLDCDGFMFTLTDHSANGTSINGVRLQRDVPTQLDDGAEVLLGGMADQLGVRFTFSNMIGKTQVWSPGGMPAGAPAGEGATMLKADMAAVRGAAAARPPAAPAPKGRVAPWMIIVGLVAVLVLLLACGGVVAVAWYLLSGPGSQTPMLIKPALTFTLPPTLTVALAASATPKKLNLTNTPVKAVPASATKPVAPAAPTATTKAAEPTSAPATVAPTAAPAADMPALCATGKSPVRVGSAAYNALTADAQLFACGNSQACLGLRLGNTGTKDYSIQVDKSNGKGKAVVMQGMGFDFASAADPQKYLVYITVPAQTAMLPVCLQFDRAPEGATAIIFQWLVEGTGGGTSLTIPLKAP
jgi:hypothetical protein